MSSLIVRKIRNSVSKALVALFLMTGTAWAQVALEPTVVFTPAAITKGETSTLTVSIANTNENVVNDVAFTTALPDGLTYDDATLATSCGTATLTGTAPTISLDFSAGTVPAAVGTTPGICEITVTATSTVPASNGTATRTVEIAVNAVTGTVSSNPIPANTTAGVGTLTSTLGQIQAVVSFNGLYNTRNAYTRYDGQYYDFTFTNTNPVPMTGVNFSHNLRRDVGLLGTTPNGTVLANAIANDTLSTSCTGATLATSITGGITTVSLSGATLAPDETCVIRAYMDFTPPAGVIAGYGGSGFTDNSAIPAGAVQSDQGATNAIISSLDPNVLLRAGVGLSTSFDPSGIEVDDPTRLFISFRNNGVPDLINQSLDDLLPSGLTWNGEFSSTPGCGTSVSPTQDTSEPRRIQVTGFDLVGPLTTPSSPTCTMRFGIAAPNAGTYDYEIGGTTNTPVLTFPGFGGLETGTPRLATATLNVVEDSNLDVVKLFRPSGGTNYGGIGTTLLRQGGISSYRINLTNTSATDDITDVSLLDNLQATIGAGVEIFGPSLRFTRDNGATTCVGTVTAHEANDTVTLTGGVIPAGETCSLDFDVFFNKKSGEGTNAGETNVIPVGNITSFSEGTYELPIGSTTVRSAGRLDTATRFSPAQVGSNGVSPLEIAITGINVNLHDPLDLQDLTVNLDLRSGITLSPTPNLVSGCGGTITPVAGDPTWVQITGGNLFIPVSGPAPTCSIFVDVVAGSGTGSGQAREQPGEPNIGGRLTAGVPSDVLGTPRAELNLRFVGRDSLRWSPAEVAVAQTFTPDIVDVGEASRLRINIINANVFALSEVTFSDLLDNGLFLSGTPDPVLVGTGCGGTITAPANGNTISLADGVVPANATCGIEVNVVPTVRGNSTNTIAAGAITSREGATNTEPVSQSLQVNPAVGLVKSFAPAQIQAGQISTLTLTLTNAQSTPETLTTAGGGDPAGLTDNFPADLFIAADPNIQTSCGIAVTADPGGSSVVLNGGTVPAGGGECTVSVDVTVALEVDDGYENTILANAISTISGATNRDPATATLNVIRNIATLVVTKTVESSTWPLPPSQSPLPLAEGDTVTYRFDIENEGNVNINNVVPVDVGPTFGGNAGTNALTSFVLVPVAGNDPNLAPGETVTYEVTYELSAADAAAVANSSDPATAIVNTASAFGVVEAGTLEVTPDTVETGIEPDPSITLEKTAEVGVTAGRDAEATDFGDEITYTLTVTNAGNVALRDVEITEETLSLGIDGSGAETSLLADLVLVGTTGVEENGSLILLPRQTATFEVVYEITSGAFAAGGVLNEAIVRAEDTSGNEQTDSASVATALDSVAALVVTKTVVNVEDLSSPLAEGDTVTYEFVIENTGNLDVTGVSPNDPGPTFDGVPGTGTMGVPSLIAGNADLGPNETVTYRATYELSAADAIVAANSSDLATVIENTAGANGTSAVGEPQVTPGSAVTGIDPDPSIEIVKTGVVTVDRGRIPAQADDGDAIIYTLVVTNDGNVNLRGVEITSETLRLGLDGSGAQTDLLGDVVFVETSGSFIDGDLILSPGQNASYMVEYLITPEAFEAGGVQNIAVVSATDTENETLNDTATAQTPLSEPVNVEAIEAVLSDDLLQTTRTLSSNVSRISRDAADRLRISRGQECGEAINGLLGANPVQFASDSFFIDARNDAVLDEVARLLGECANSSFLIAGHTDSDASDAYNIVLSQNRVDAVRRALAERGVVVDRLRTQGFGESRPIATNATPEGKALNRRVEFIWLDDDAAQPGCGDNQQMTRNLNGSGNDDGARMDGNFLSTGYDCASGTYRETWAELNVTHEDDRGTFGMLSTGLLRERQGDNRLFGQFVEGYLSRSDVDTPDASGTITGVGIHAGLYGARGYENGLILSYYGSAAAGRHSFEIDTGAPADGHYTYAAIFAGGALGGETKLGDMPVKPRVGIDLAYAEAIESEISVPDITLEIEPAKVARGYAEVAFLHATQNGLLTITPRLFCETNGNQATDACGAGGSIDYATTHNAEGRQWKFGFDYEAIDNRQSASLDIAHSREILDGMGVSRSSLGATMNGALELGQTIEIKW